MDLDNLLSKMEMMLKDKITKINQEHHIDAHKSGLASYSNISHTKALQEIKNGKKYTHWIWYVFPQINDLGYSPISKQFELTKEQAELYLQNNILRQYYIATLTTTSKSLEEQGRTLQSIFGNDAQKVISSMTLFRHISQELLKQDQQYPFKGDCEKITQLINEIQQKTQFQECDATCNKLGTQKILPASKNNPNNPNNPNNHIPQDGTAAKATDIPLDAVIISDDYNDDIIKSKKQEIKTQALLLVNTQATLLFNKVGNKNVEMEWDKDWKLTCEKDGAYLVSNDGKKKDKFDTVKFDDPLKEYQGALNAINQELSKPVQKPVVDPKQPQVPKVDQHNNAQFIDAVTQMLAASKIQADISKAQIITFQEKDSKIKTTIDLRQRTFQRGGNPAKTYDVDDPNDGMGSLSHIQGVENGITDVEIDKKKVGALQQPPKPNPTNPKILINLKEYLKNNNELKVQKKLVVEYLEKLNQTVKDEALPELYHGIGAEVESVLNEDGDITGFKVTKVFDGGIAKNAGLKTGDTLNLQTVITKQNDEEFIKDGKIMNKELKDIIEQIRNLNISCFQENDGAVKKLQKSIHDKTSIEDNFFYKTKNISFDDIKSASKNVESQRIL